MPNRTTTATGARRALLCVLALGLLFLPTPARAGGNSTCTFSSGRVYVNLQNDGSSGILQRNAGGVILYQAEGDASPQPCGLATVFTTDRIKVEDTSDDGGTAIFLDVSQGDFSDGIDDIPVRIDLGAGAIDAFGLIGGSGADHWTFGANRKGLTRGNLQNNESAEIKFSSQPDFGFGASGAGNDRACSRGGGGIPRQSLIGWVWIGGGGADKLCGGLTSDRLVGRGGNDNLAGGRGGDTLKGGDGADALKGGASGDLLRGGPGPDNLRGGGGFDRCSGGPGADQEARCER